jgi:hypothetical protein
MASSFWPFSILEVKKMQGNNDFNGQDLFKKISTGALNGLRRGVNLAKNGNKMLKVIVGGKILVLLLVGLKSLIIAMIPLIVIVSAFLFVYNFYYAITGNEQQYNRNTDNLLTDSEEPGVRTLSSLMDLSPQNRDTMVYFSLLSEMSISKYFDGKLTKDRNVKDYYNREDDYKIPFHILLSISQSIFGREGSNYMLYPEQFITPVWFSKTEDKFSLKDLTDYQYMTELSSDGLTEEGLRDYAKKENTFADYGLGSVVSYISEERIEYTEERISGYDIVVKETIEPSEDLKEYGLLVDHRYYVEKIRTEKDIEKIIEEINENNEGKTASDEGYKTIAFDPRESSMITSPKLSRRIAVKIGESTQNKSQSKTEEIYVVKSAITFAGEQHFGYEPRDFEIAEMRETSRSKYQTYSFSSYYLETMKDQEGNALEDEFGNQLMQLRSNTESINLYADVETKTMEQIPVVVSEEEKKIEYDYLREYLMNFYAHIPDEHIEYDFERDLSGTIDINFELGVNKEQANFNSFKDKYLEDIISSSNEYPEVDRFLVLSVMGQDLSKNYSKSEILNLFKKIDELMNNFNDGNNLDRINLDLKALIGHRYGKNRLEELKNLGGQITWQYLFWLNYLNEDERSYLSNVLKYYEGDRFDKLNELGTKGDVNEDKKSFFSSITDLFKKEKPEEIISADNLIIRHSSRFGSLDSKSGEIDNTVYVSYSPEFSLSHQNFGLMLDMIRGFEHKIHWSDFNDEHRIAFIEMSPSMRFSKSNLNSTFINLGDTSIILGDLFTLPLVERFRVTSWYGPRIHPVTGERGRMHWGIDIATNISLVPVSPVVSSFDGVVYESTYEPGYGHFIAINHFENQVQTLYAHLDKRNVIIGDVVKAGDLIGYEGTTGTSTGRHLHFEIKFMDSSGKFVSDGIVNEIFKNY